MVVIVSGRRTSTLGGGERQLMIAAPLDTVNEGVVYEHLPPHLTILPWFHLPDNCWPSFNAAMEELVEEERLSSVHGASSAQYGRGGEVTVRKLAGVLLGVHAHALGVVEWMGCAVDSSFTGMNYSPHITDMPERLVAEGEPVDFSGIVIFRKEGDLKQVAKLYEWARP